MGDELGELKNVLIEKLFECCSLSSEYKKSDILEFYEECADDKNYISGFIEEVDAINKKITTDKTPKRNTHSNTKPDNLLPNTETTLQFPQKSLQSYSFQIPKQKQSIPQIVKLNPIITTQETSMFKSQKPNEYFKKVPEIHILPKTLFKDSDTFLPNHFAMTKKSLLYTSTCCANYPQFEFLRLKIGSEFNLKQCEVQLDIDLMCSSQSLYDTFYKHTWKVNTVIFIVADNEDYKEDAFGCFVRVGCVSCTWVKDPNIKLFSFIGREVQLFGLKSGGDNKSLYLCDETNKEILFAVGLGEFNDILFHKGTDKNITPTVYLKPSAFNYMEKKFFEPKIVRPKRLIVANFF
ncbi:hypothetical protein EIN_252650 [Entamoeba invadens IP1]|uniref:TLDc domain-containing protein n=1 Tax=Entamoeba invadens IP1 TaxID=370355 RepID=A0A0A1UEM6_ENTIV|nr:hypothetical protein EIN_252650 [Entamoeba invadens IP1]ELP95031.1 hypothetical protein EIN_252650 [Entamoeba invadens IP1]|eukprot:XP_004261802.1 hypothetical protein EIN_252650 [Entamoeba invadens IP1]